LAVSSWQLAVFDFLPIANCLLPTIF